MGNYPPGSFYDPRAPWNQENHHPRCPASDNAPEFIPNPDDLLDAVNNVIYDWRRQSYLKQEIPGNNVNDLVSRSLLIKLEQVVGPQCTCEENGREDYYSQDDYDPDPFRGRDAEADSDVLRSAGLGTDEDYGLYQEVV